MQDSVIAPEFLQLDPGGETVVEAPRPKKSLFLYLTDSAGRARYNERLDPLGQYDVISARPDADPITLTAATERLDYLSFYLPPYIERPGPEG
jgi:hypothetical protein